MNKKIVLPGEKLSTSEELLSGEGTFEEDGVLRADRIGIYIVDEKHKKATVKPVTSIPVILKKGDTVLAEVRSVKPSMVIAEVLHVVGKKRGISGDTNGTLRVSEISTSYVKDPSTEYAVGDIIRARVTQVKPSLQLATKDRNLGVIKGLCTRCRNALIRKGNSLECTRCGRIERRRAAIDYGEFDMNNF